MNSKFNSHNISDMFDFELKYTNLSFKADYILHTVNMHDSIFKDTYNPHSIDGLYEVMEKENIGDKKYLGQIKNDYNYTCILHSAGSELVFLEFKLSILARLQPFVSSFTFLD